MVPFACDNRDFLTGYNNCCTLFEVHASNVSVHVISFTCMTYCITISEVLMLPGTCK